MSGSEWLLDTNMVIGLLKAYGPAVNLAEQQHLRLDQAAVSQITRMELLGFPGLTAAEESEIHNFLGNCQVLLIDELVERKAIELRRAGHFKLPDAIVAATAIVYQLRLLTLDKRLSEPLAKLACGL